MLCKRVADVFPNLYGTASRKVSVVITSVQFEFFYHSGGSDYAYSIKMNEDMTPGRDSTDNTICKLKNTDVAKLASLYKPQTESLFHPSQNFPSL